jgi:hypothetical protein
LEVTFLKKDLCESKIEIPRLPIKIDYPNTSDRTDFNLSPFFDLSKSFLGVLMNILRIKLDAID